MSTVCQKVSQTDRKIYSAPGRQSDRETVEEEMHNRLRVSLFTGRVARWSVSVALCQSILRIRLVVCVGRDAKERWLERPLHCDVM